MSLKCEYVSDGLLLGQSWMVVPLTMFFYVQKHWEGVCCCLHVNYIVCKHFNSAHCSIIVYICVRFQYIPTRVLNFVVNNMWVLVVVHKLVI